MKKPLTLLGFALSIVLAGLIGFSMAVDVPSPKESMETVQLNIDLTKPEPTAVKAFETEPEEMPNAEDIQVEIVSRSRREDHPLRVLIYHTHTYEAYEPDFENQYKQTERWRTADPAFNMVRIGAELAEILRAQYGMEVIHDDTAFEPPNLDSAYMRSLETIENYTARGETFDLYLDLHRDAYAQGRFEKNTVTVGEKEIARVMFLIGKGSGTYNGQAFAQKPIWEKNYLRADVMTEAINTLAENLCRPVSTKASRYNQHVSTGALLIEIGNNMNSLEEALGAVPYIARAIAETSGGNTIMLQDTVLTE